jgi:hypothetical protein
VCGLDVFFDLAGIALHARLYNLFAYPITHLKPFASPIQAAQNGYPNRNPMPFKRLDFDGIVFFD